MSDIRNGFLDSTIPHQVLSITMSSLRRKRDTCEIIYYLGPKNRMVSIPAFPTAQCYVEEAHHESMEVVAWPSILGCEKGL
jgi:hypothetical protein